MNMQIRTIVVTKTSTISIFDYIFKNEAFIPQYIFNGILLDKNSTLSLYGIRNEDYIYFFDPSNSMQPNKSEIQNIVSVAKMNNAGGRSALIAKSAADNEFREEICKINDLRMMRKIEQAGKFTGIVLSCPAKIQPKEPTKIPITRCISTTALPNLW